jgi:hypothetical protein
LNALLAPSPKMPMVVRFAWIIAGNAAAITFVLYGPISRSTLSTLISLA